MKTNKLVMILFIAVVLLLIMMPQCFAGDQELKSLDFDITLNDKGDMKVVETWDIKVYDTNTLFKTFSYSKNKGGNYKITDVTVKDLTNGDGYQMRDVGQWMYHVDKGGYYAANNDDGMFEIGWSADSVDKTSHKKYKITYTVENLVNVYNDCSEFYWILTGYGASIIPAENVTGTVHLPLAVSNLDDLLIWAHGPLTGEIDKKDNKTVVFNVPELFSDEYLEIRIATPNNIFEQATNIHNSNRLDTIINEETAWAEEANAKREQAKKLAETIKYGSIGGVVLSFIVFISSGLKSKRELEDRPEKQIQKLDYFRDFPAENASPGEAEFMRNAAGFNTQNVFSGIFMDLALKKYIDIEPIPDEKKNVKIRILQNSNEMLKDELAVYDFIQRAANGKSSGLFSKKDEDFDDKSVVTMKQFRSYCESHETAAYNLWTSLKDKAIAGCRTRGSYDDAIKKQGLKVGGRTAVAGLAIVGIGFLAMALQSWILVLAIIPIVYALMQHSKLTASYIGYTVQGWEEHERWKGLKKYMEDFSMLNERDIPELALWERYMVYATAFGISEKVLKQLKVAYPQLTDEYMYNHYRTMYYMDTFNVGREFGTSMSRGYQSYANSRMSSGSGGGGGFSGGGGGGFGGGGSGGR